MVNAFETAGPKRNKTNNHNRKAKWHTSITYNTTRTNNKKLHNIEEAETDRQTDRQTNRQTDRQTKGRYTI